MVATPPEAPNVDSSWLSLPCLLLQNLTYCPSADQYFLHPMEHFSPLSQLFLALVLLKYFLLGVNR